MIIEDTVKIKEARFRKKDKVYKMYFVTFSIKYSNILSKFRELHNVEILTDSNKIVLPKVNLFKHSYYYQKKTGEKIPQISFVIPKDIAEELWNKGERKLKVITELPDLTVKS